MGRETSEMAVLLVDDDADCRLLVRDAVTTAASADLGCGSFGPVAGTTVVPVVYEVASGAEAVRFLRREGPYADAPRPGLIYLDLEMPGGVDGLDLLRRIRADAGLRDVPVVMMSGVADPDAVRAAAAAGANSYTVKPADAGQFLATVAASANYWLNVHHYPDRVLPPAACRR